MQAYPHHYQVAAASGASGTVRLTSRALPPLESTPPPEFDGPEGYWSPETLLLASVADCYSLSVRAIARASRLEWQDLSVDIPRGRHYLPRADCATYGACQSELLALQSTRENARLIADCAHWARTMMQSGAPLVHRLPGRAGWELRLVVQGGLRILDKVDALKGGSLHTRPKLRGWDWCVMLGRALLM